MNALRLRPGLHYAPVEGGVYFSSARATFVVKGPAALFRLVDTCVPLLEDGATVDELVDAVGSPAAKPVIVRLLDAFGGRALLLHLDELVGAEPSHEERDRFPETLAYLETHCDDPYTAFRRVRDARVIVAGPTDAVGPAVRGLVRSGVGQVLVATDEPQRLASLAARYPTVDVLVHLAGDLPLPTTDGLAQVAVIFSEDTFPNQAIGRLPPSCAAVPVRLGKDVAIVGPAVLSARDREWSMAAAESCWGRSCQWSQFEGDELLVRPSGDLLAGALAGQLALDTLVGLNAGQVHLVHGPDLRSDSITSAWQGNDDLDAAVGWAGVSGGPTEAATATPATPATSPATPATAPATPATLPATPATSPATPATLPGTPGTGDWTTKVSAPWSGLFRLAVPDDLPQMPLSLTVADGRSPWFQGRVVGFGPDQETSTAEAALEALREHCGHGDDGHHGHGHGRSSGGDDGHGDDGHGRGDGRSSGGSPSIVVAAAGRSETQGLLDGALRLLAATVTESVPIPWLGVDDARVRRLWRTVEEHEFTPVEVTTGISAALGWHLVAVRGRYSGARLGAGWGPTLAAAAEAALSSAVATVQVRRTIDPSYVPPAAGPGYVEHLHEAAQAELTAAVSAWLDAIGKRLCGQRLKADGVSGQIGAWCGSVWLDD